MVPYQFLNNYDLYQLATHTNQGELNENPQIIKCSASPNTSRHWCRVEILTNHAYNEKLCGGLHTQTARFHAQNTLNNVSYSPSVIVTPGIPCTSLNL